MVKKKNLPVTELSVTLGNDFWAKVSVQLQGNSLFLYLNNQKVFELFRYGRDAMATSYSQFTRNGSKIHVEYYDLK